MSPRPRTRAFLAAALALCLAPRSARAATAAPLVWTHPQGTLSVVIRPAPFSLAVKDGSGKVVLESAPPAVDGKHAYAAIALTHGIEWQWPIVSKIMKGWDFHHTFNRPWADAASVQRWEKLGPGIVLHVAAPGRGLVKLTLSPNGPGVRLVAKPEGPNAEHQNRVSMAFVMHDDDHFFGFGERFVRADHRGQKLYNWVEDGGFGLGEKKKPGPTNPFPKGEGQTNIPIPWFLSPRGFAVLLDGTFRTVYHLGDETPKAWRAEAWTDGLDVTLFADPDPLKLIDDLVSVTGRPPELPDWMLGPRRRGNPDAIEDQKLRDAKIPTTSIDTAVHYFPFGAGYDSAAMQKLTQRLHAQGYKAIAYFCSFISPAWQPVFNEAAANGYLVKRRDGKPYMFTMPYKAALIDFTNPAAKKWYQSWLERAVADGWDGWMYDFGEYLPEDAVLYNGMSGKEAHNLYPLLYQRAAREVYDRHHGDILIFSRSGFTGTGGILPMVWGGDQNADFSKTDGLPAALTGALNAGMSGVPYWGSDISGYHFLFNKVPDKEVYLRWTELGAFSVEMHDENEGEGFHSKRDRPKRWQIWKDQESQDVYRKYASLKTRMVPYVQMAVEEAHASGTPVMRHLVLEHPKDPNVYGITDEYMFGDSLLVAPVVERGARARSVYFPEGRYFDYWNGVRVSGPGRYGVRAPLDGVPVFAKMGALIPMLHPDVQTLADGPSSVPSERDYANFLEIDVFPGGTTTARMKDGTVLSQSAPVDPFEIAPPRDAQGELPRAARSEDLMTCERGCWIPASGRHPLWIAVVAGDAKVTAGPLSLEAAGSQPRRYLFKVRY